MDYLFVRDQAGHELVFRIPMLRFSFHNVKPVNCLEWKMRHSIRKYGSH